METQTIRDLPLSVRYAQRLNRIISWGMTAPERNAFLAEALTDSGEMHADQGPLRVFLRASRGIPAGMWARFTESDTTALPASVAIAFVGLAGLGAGLLDTTYPMDMRRFVLLSAFGLFILGATLISNPRQIILHRYRLPGAMLAAGFIGMAFNMPAQTDWPYDTPFVDTVLADRLIAVGFVAVGIGAALLVMASFLKMPRLIVATGGFAIMLGTAMFAAGQIAWGIVAVTTDPAITATSVAVGLAALSFLHVLPRLRKLEFV